MRQFFAESFGTYGLVFFGTGAIVVNDLYGGSITPLGISIIVGCVVMAMIYTFGEISGAHINPAVTIAFWLSGRFPGKKVLPYILAQLFGATLASATLQVLFPEHIGLGATVPVGGVLRSFVLETILAFFLMLVIVNVSTGARELGIMAGVAIGATVMIEALFAGPISGGSMNPARSLAPALVTGNLSHLWIYCSAPVLGAALAVIAFRSVSGKALAIFDQEP